MRLQQTNSHGLGADISELSFCGYLSNIDGKLDDGQFAVNRQR